MARRTMFCVQAWRRRDGQLVAADRQEFTSATEAEDVGARLAKNAAGVIVFAMEGDPDADVWDEHEVFASHGEVPDGARAL